MISRACAALAAAIVAAMPAHAQDFVVERGIATVDGVISAGEWDKANRVRMDKVYDATPVDLTNAWWAALWDASNNLVYVAIRGTDTDHVLHAYTTWDGQDSIELYINARNDDTENYENMATRKFDYAQQYVAGYDPAVTSLWLVLGGGNAMPSHTLPAAAFGLVTNQYTYEFAIRPYDFYDYDNVTNSTQIKLRAGLVMGLDVVMNTRMSDNTFGMRCENQIVGKFYLAGTMRDYRLLGPAGTVFHVSCILVAPGPR